MLKEVYFQMPYEVVKEPECKTTKAKTTCYKCTDLKQKRKHTFSRNYLLWLTLSMTCTNPFSADTFGWIIWAVPSINTWNNSSFMWLLCKILLCNWQGILLHFLLWNSVKFGRWVTLFGACCSYWQIFP